MAKRTFGEITVSEGVDCALVTFPFDLQRKDKFRQAFSRAIWLPAISAWSIPGRSAFDRALIWAANIESAETKEIGQREQSFEKSARQGQRHEVDPAAALVHRRAEIQSARVRLEGVNVTYDFRYSAAAVDLAKTLPGARYDRLTVAWTWTARSMADVDAIISGCNRIKEIVATEIEVERKDAMRRETEAEARRVQRDEEAQRVRAHRFVDLAASAPAVGAVLRRYGDAIVVESLGEIFLANDEISSMGGPVGVEGERVRYVYFRLADAHEIKSLEAREAADEAAVSRRVALRFAIDQVSRSEDAPDLGAAPVGETIWSDDSAAATGYRVSIVLTPDGWLWHVTYDGSDGAKWGKCNLGYNTSGVRVPATPELVAMIRGETQ